MKNRIKRGAGLIALVAIVSLSNTTLVAQEKLSLEDQITKHRAIESIVWSMPIMSSKAMQDGLERDAGVGLNDVAYFSQIQNWKIDFTTNNNTTPYIHVYWNVEKEPMVVEIPVSTADVGLVGTLLDYWQRSMIAVGANGYDGGRGAKYLIMSEDYQGGYPEGYVAVYQKTYGGSTTLRPIIKNTSQETLAKVSEFVKGIKVYPFSQAGNPPATKHIDIFDKPINGLVPFDETYFEQLNELLQEERIEEKDLTFLGMLESIGIEKGMPYSPTKKQLDLFKAGAKDAEVYLRDSYLERAAGKYYDDRQWTNAVPTSGVMSFMDWSFPSHVNYDQRGAAYFGFYTSFRKLGAASFYLKVARDDKGESLNGSNDYVLTVPANVPMRNFWSVIAYETKDATWIDNMPKAGVASIDKGVKKNKDGTVDIYFSAKPPKGKEANWVPTAEGDDFFLFFRLYGPEKAVWDKSWKLNDLQKIR